MPEWQERITVETEPALRVEHELRYQLAGRAIAQARTWCDLGCGNGVAAQTSLQGSAIVAGDEEAAYDVSVRVPPAEVVPTHFLAAFGPRAHDALGGAAVTPVDLDEQRRWVRERESSISFLEDAKEFAALAARERDEWRRYIHELEDRLGIPRSGVAD